MNSIAKGTAGFDYDALTEDFAGTLVATAERIRNCAGRAATSIIDVGRELLTVKSELEHGLFLRWIEAEFSWSDRTAAYYMAVAREWGDVTFAPGANLPVKLLCDLSSKNTPAEIKAEVRADLDAGRPVDVKAVRDRIKSAKPSRPSQSAPIEVAPEQEPDQEPEADRIDRERKAAAIEVVGIVRKLSAPDVERFAALIGKASIWVIQDMLGRGRA